MIEKRKDYWFKPKRYGYGATPVHWKGWLLVLGFIVWVSLISAVLIVVPTLYGEPENIGKFLIWLGLLVVSVIGLIGISRSRTDGDWRWRWGEEN